jgi:hypothetical protein
LSLNLYANVVCPAFLLELISSSTRAERRSRTAQKRQQEDREREVRGIRWRDCRRTFLLVVRSMEDRFI